MKFLHEFKAGLDIGVKAYVSHGKIRRKALAAYKLSEKREKELDKARKKEEKEAKKEVKQLKEI